VRRFLLVALTMLPLALAAACGDSTGLGDPRILVDSSATLSVPTATDTIPSALDMPRFTLRRPEQLADAQEWDFALRNVGGVLKLTPNPFTSESRRPLIARSTAAFASLDKAPTARSAYGDTAITVQSGAVYLMRSRTYSTGVGSCYSYGKLQVTALDLVAENATFIFQVNTGCADDRLEAD
jgi:hypothetical protein